MIRKACLASALAALFATSAQAHVTLLQREAPVGGGYRAVFAVPHGCAGSPTVKVRVRIPEGVIGVKPMPKAGWKLEVVKGKYDKPYPMYHSTLTEGAREVIWTGRLSDEDYDEFLLSTYLSDGLTPGQMLYFPVVQECETGVNRWIEIPAADKSGNEPKEPAPGVKLLPKKSDH